MKSTLIVTMVTVILVTCNHLVTCLSHNFLLGDDVIDDENTNSANGQFSNIDDDGIEMTENEKRAELSLNGELRSLADMVNQARRQGERSTQHSALLQLGKRSWRFPIFDFHKLKIKSSSNGNKQYPRISTVTRRRSQQLSVSGPLSALANMLAVEGRRRKEKQSLHNRMKLLQTGKRNGGDESFHGVLLNEDDSYDSDYL